MTNKQFSIQRFLFYFGKESIENEYQPKGVKLNSIKNDVCYFLE